ncbi:MAG TPA: recombinase family protein [Streptosporangiaceae bacterium]|nr:recombinase family protein [Streptosporangiaceae bacterium]
MRLVQAARLSKLKDSSSSIEKQDDEMRRWADARGHEIVGTAVDTDVSGGISPFGRPGLGPWLAEPGKIASYDGILASHIDRLGRSTSDFTDLLRWAEQNGKTVITTALGDTVDFSQGVGKLLGWIMMWLAEQELEAAKRRTSGTFEYLRDHGYVTGPPPFGYVTESDGRHKVLQPDTALMDANKVHVISRMADMYLRGDTLATICRWLDSEGIRSRSGRPWNPATVADIFRNPLLIGWMMSKGQVVRCETGEPLVRTTPVMGVAKWKQLQDRLADNPAKRLPKESAPLARVIYCFKCHGPMRRFTSRRTGKNGQQYANTYYRCDGKPTAPSTCKNMIREDELESGLEYNLMDSYGDLEVVRRELIPGNDVAARIESITESMATLEADRYQRGLFSGESGTARFAMLYGNLETTLAALREQVAIEDHWEDVPLGTTVRQRFSEMDARQRGDFLRSASIKAYVLSKRPDTSVTFPAEADPEQHELPFHEFPDSRFPVVTTWTPNADEARRLITTS